MSTTRRIFVLIGAPLVVIVGLGAVWGFKNGAALVAQIESWAHDLEHSANPVVMNLPFVPLYVDGRRVGNLETVVVQRTEPGSVDSLRVTVAGSLDRASPCHLQLDVDAFGEGGPFGLKRAVRCRPDTTGMVSFGTIVFRGADGERRLYLRADHVPCAHLSGDAAGEACVEPASELAALKRQIRDEVRFELRNLRSEIRTEVRKSVRGH